MNYIGIDPGRNGGIAVITEYGKATTVPYSDLGLIGLIKLLKENDEKCFAIVEKVGAMPGQGVVSMFNFGKSFGYILGVLECSEISYQLVPPQKWKKEYSLNSNKEDSIKVCQRLFPQVSLLKTPRCTKPHDGMAEALLMAEYARRIHGDYYG